MGGIAIVFDLLRKNPTLHSSKVFHSSGLFADKLATTAAAAYFASATPFVSRVFGLISYWYVLTCKAICSNGGISVAYCDAAAGLSEEYISRLQSVSGNNKGVSEDTFPHDSFGYTKEYNIELKPLFSAFGFKALAMTSLRSFLMYYLPLLEPRANMEDDDDDFLADSQERNVDLVVPFKKSVKQIIRETSVVTTRRILERVAVHYVSQRMAWKLLKDVPRSSIRKAQRGMPFYTYFYCVSKTTFRGHFLGVAASWMVQVTIETYRFFRSLLKPNEDGEKVNTAEQVKLLGLRVYGASMRCGASLVFASIGAGICATLIHPSTGQWIGCAVGDLAGPIIVAVCLDKVLHVDV
ncbi:hypothetical protein RJ641_034738 [Dillenia turbinata]|uniref:Uncharacterized protein n=1 Tax=Dillenia turbinata TaxID=194707 RepID=A0AAN8VGE5_9MAGN